MKIDSMLNRDLIHSVNSIGRQVYDIKDDYVMPLGDDTVCRDRGDVQRCEWQTGRKDRNVICHQSTIDLFK